MATYKVFLVEISKHGESWLGFFDGSSYGSSPYTPPTDIIKDIECKTYDHTVVNKKTLESKTCSATCYKATISGAEHIFDEYKYHGVMYSPLDIFLVRHTNLNAGIFFCNILGKNIEKSSLVVSLRGAVDGKDIGEKIQKKLISKKRHAHVE